MPGPTSSTPRPAPATPPTTTSSTTSRSTRRPAPCSRTPPGAAAPPTTASTCRAPARRAPSGDQPRRRDQPEEHRQHRVRLRRRRLAALRRHREPQPAADRSAERQQRPVRRVRVAQRLRRGPLVADRRLPQARQQRLGAQANAAGKGYGPGVQAWYNNFIEVDPANPEHVYLGLEEVFETTNGGSGWTTRRPVLELRLPVLGHQRGEEHLPRHDALRPALDRHRGRRASSSATTAAVHPARSTRRRAPGPARPRHLARVGGPRHAAVLLGRRRRGPRAATGCAVSGGLQDNGGSLIRGGASTMVSPFGGDGGDIDRRRSEERLPDLDEYVYLTL